MEYSDSACIPIIVIVVLKYQYERRAWLELKAAMKVATDYVWEIINFG